MKPSQTLRIALLTHSTNPRGGVVHALALGEALGHLGHEVVVHAPDATNGGFFRSTSCETVCIPATPVRGDTAELVETRIADYVRYFKPVARRRFDVFHTQDAISANGMATLKEGGLVSRFARTVHHLDTFADERLGTWQTRSVVAADQLFAVSHIWGRKLGEIFGRSAKIVGNGVDRTRFTPKVDGREKALRQRFGLQSGPVFLCVGGIEERKNTIRALEAFDQVLSLQPTAQLVIAGGASLLDHRAYQNRFASVLARCRSAGSAVVCTGPLPDADMPALYRIADALVFPSLEEGFGLVILEAMASGLPVVTARIAPFTEYLGDEDAVWCDRLSISSIANAMVSVLNAPLRARLIARGAIVAAEHNWQDAARAHLPFYEMLRDPQHA